MTIASLRLKNKSKNSSKSLRNSSSSNSRARIKTGNMMNTMNCMKILWSMKSDNQQTQKKTPMKRRWLQNMKHPILIQR